MPTPNPYDTLTRGEKCRFTRYQGRHPETTAEQWIAAGKPGSGKPKGKGKKKASGKKKPTPRPAPNPAPEAAPGTETRHPEPRTPDAPRELAPVRVQGESVLLEAEPLQVAEQPSRLRVIAIDAELTPDGVAAITNQLANVFAPAPGR